MRSTAYASSTRPGLSHAASSSSSSSPWAANPIPTASHSASAASNSHIATSAYPPLGATPPPAAPRDSHSSHSHSHSHHHHHTASHHGHANSHAHHAAAAAAASQNSLQNASTALDRVLAMLDGFEVSRLEAKSPRCRYFGLTHSTLCVRQDDMDCPLCLEEMDISDLNFKPCPCGYQVSLDPGGFRRGFSPRQVADPGVLPPISRHRSAASAIITSRRT